MVNLDSPLSSISAGHEAMSIASDLRRLPEDESSSLTVQAKMLNYMPNSLESLDWDRADAFSYKNTRLISVPLSGPEDLLAVNRVVFYFEQDEIHTTEIYTTIKDAHNANVKSWADNELIHNKNIELPSETEAQNTTEITLAGLDWNKLNDCLGRLHINSWVAGTIAFVCGAACAATFDGGCVFCVGLATGIKSADLVTCISHSWT
ncbi:hypothetical protein [Arcanobacterium phocae]|uniref:hypothetical protein n=1 Tax=Arcanobacterium phocae TaxID=131112 RepID=UPI001C0F012D|nr:hypothetical protein [Arcanobacterium phocae]